MTDLATMTHEVWTKMPQHVREAIRDNGSLTPQLVGLEGWRVEVVDTYGATRRFIVGRSTGWRPIHLEVARRNSSGGMAADKEYRSVRRLYDTGRGR